MAIFRRHPSRQALADWLSGESTDLDQHLATCTRCAAVVEDLDSDAPPLLISALAQMFEAPDGLSDRLEQRVTERVGNHELFGLASDLLGAGVETAVLLATNKANDNAEQSEFGAQAE